MGRCSVSPSLVLHFNSRFALLGGSRTPHQGHVGLYCHLVLICERPASRFRKALGFALNLASATRSGRFTTRKNIRGGKDLLGHRSFGTTGKFHDAVASGGARIGGCVEEKVRTACQSPIGQAASLVMCPRTDTCQESRAVAQNSCDTRSLARRVKRRRATRR